MNDLYIIYNTKLIFKWYFNQSVDDIYLPDYITHIEFGDLFNYSIKKVKWPRSVKKLTIGTYVKTLPNKIYPITQFNNELDNLPNTLETLKICNLKQPLLNLPLSLKKLKIRRTEKEIIEQCKIPFNCKLVIE
jgi:hypothetical protein